MHVLLVLLHRHLHKLSPHAEAFHLSVVLPIHVLHPLARLAVLSSGRLDRTCTAFFFFPLYPLYRAVSSSTTPLYSLISCIPSLSTVVFYDATNHNLATILINGGNNTLISFQQNS